MILTPIITNGKVYKAKELEAIAELYGLPVHRVLLLQLYYKANAGCTTLVTEDRRMIRTMDWSLTLLKKITFNLNVIKDNVNIGTATT